MADGSDEGDGEAAPGMGLPEAMGIITALMLIAAILLTDHLLGKHYGQGMFF